MGPEFSIYFNLGLEHILDWDGYDHILFIVALCAPYHSKRWKNILILATAFTIGHSITLAMYTLDYIAVDSRLVEILIPITILITVLFNLISKEKTNNKIEWNYLLAMGFGLIHGLGFANFFKAMMGNSEGVSFPLFAFNIGIEFGQIAIITFLLIIQFGLFRHIKLSLSSWNYMLSIIIGLLSLKLLIELLTQ